MKKNLILIILVLGIVSVGGFVSNKDSVNTATPASSVAVVVQDTFSYDGAEGKDALSLLKEKAEVKESQPGFVSSINGRVAGEENREYWAFYINGKMSEVGAGDYQTKEGDKLEWKIENY